MAATLQMQVLSFNNFCSACFIWSSTFNKVCWCQIVFWQQTHVQKVIVKSYSPQYSCKIKDLFVFVVTEYTYFVFLFWLAENMKIVPVIYKF